MDSVLTLGTNKQTKRNPGDPARGCSPQGGIIEPSAAGVPREPVLAHWGEQALGKLRKKQSAVDAAQKGLLRARNMIAESRDILATTILPEGRAECAHELLNAAVSLADNLLAVSPAVALGKRGGKRPQNAVLTTSAR